MKPEKQLYQWDVNQYLTELQPTAEFVDYPIGNDVIRIKSDGTRCRIPDEVLQTYGGKTCYERYPDGTYRAYSFTVLYAPKPPDYVYTPEERTTFEALTARVDAAIEDIKRRADSGEFTPKKGVDYFTDAEKAEMMEIVSDGAIGEFRNVVDTATTEYNDNASEKLTTYDTNAEQHTTDYNRNAEVKLEAYNSNHAAKVAEYNQNAETKTEEFDSNAAALQTEVDRLRGECDQLAEESRKQENRISALMKLNKGQTYDILPEEGEAASRTAPSGAKYVSVDSVGGKSVVWNQLINGDGHNPNITFLNGKFTYSDYASGVLNLNTNLTLISGHKYYAKASKPFNNVYVMCYTSDVAHKLFQVGNVNTDKVVLDTIVTCDYTASDYRLYVNRYGATSDTPVSNYEGYVMLFDLTQMFGSTIADYIYSIEQSQAGAGVEWFKKLFPANYYPYSEPTIISSQTDRVDVASSNLIYPNMPFADRSGYISSGVTYTYDKNRVITINGTRAENVSGSLGLFSYGALSNGKYTLSIYDEHGNYARDVNINVHETPPYTFTVNDSNRNFIITILASISGKKYNNAKYYIKLEKDSKSTPYNPHIMQQITTGFPALNSVGSVYDYIDLNEGKLHRRVGEFNLTHDSDMSLISYTEETGIYLYQFKIAVNNTPDNMPNICNRFTYYAYSDRSIAWKTDGAIVSNRNGISRIASKMNMDKLKAFLGANDTIIKYVLVEEVIEDITIPTELTDWIEVEAGGTVTFRNADESKQLAVPNAVSWVRKLDEVE